MGPRGGRVRPDNLTFLVVEGRASLLARNGNEVVRFVRSSANLAGMPLGQVRAFFSGIYNPVAKKQFAAFLDTHRPDVVHIHNLCPLISPSISHSCPGLDHGKLKSNVARTPSAA